MAKLIFGSTYYLVLGNNLKKIQDTWLFWEHFMKVLGALLVPGALVGKH
jgi:hypothetical protein